MELTDRIFKFLERFNTPVSSHGLGLFRVLFSLHLLLIIREFYHVHPLIFDMMPGTGKTPVPVRLFVSLWSFSAAMMMLGLFTRIAAVSTYILTLLGTILFINGNVASFNDDLLRIGSLLCIFMPVSRSFSFDSWLDKMRSPNPRSSQTTRLNYILFLFISLGLLYTASGVTKLCSPMWLKGLGFWIPNNIPYNKWNGIPNLIINEYGLSLFLNYSVIVWELVFIFFLFFPRLHKWIAIPGIFFHIGIALFYPFPLICTGPLSFYVLFLDDRFWIRLKKWFAVEKPLIWYVSETDTHAQRLSRTIQVLDYRSRITFKPATEGMPVSEGDSLRSTFNQYVCYRPFLWMVGIPVVKRMIVFLYNFVINPGFTAPRSPFVRMKAAQTILVYFTLFCLTMQAGVTGYHVYHRLKYRLGFGSVVSMKSRPQYDLKLKPGVLVRIFLGINGRGVFLDHDSKWLKHTYALTYFDQTGQEFWLPMMNQRGYVGSSFNMNMAWSLVTFHKIAFGANPADSAGLKNLTRFWAIRSGVPLDHLHLKVYKRVYQYPAKFEKDYYLTQEALPWLEEGEIWWRNGIFSYYPAKH